MFRLIHERLLQSLEMQFLPRWRHATDGFPWTSTFLENSQNHSRSSVDCAGECKLATMTTMNSETTKCNGERRHNEAQSTTKCRA